MVECDDLPMTSSEPNSFPPTSGAPAAPSVFGSSAPLSESDARTFAALTHVSALFFPLVGPLVAYLVFLHRSPLVEHHAKEQINLAISLFLYSIIAVVTTVATLGIGLLVVVPLAIIVPMLAFVLTIVAAVSASRGEYYRFPCIIRLVP